MELSLQYPLRGNLITCRPSNWFHATPDRASRIAWFVSGKISSKTFRSEDMRIRSPKSGLICSATTSKLSLFIFLFDVDFVLFGDGERDVDVLIPFLIRSRFICSICRIIAMRNVRKKEDFVLTFWINCRKQTSITNNTHGQSQNIWLLLATNRDHWSLLRLIASSFAWSLRCVETYFRHGQWNNAAWESRVR